MSRPLQIRALVTLLLVGMALAFGFGTARAGSASPCRDTPVAIHQIAASQDRVLVAATDATHIDAHRLVANMLDCCASSIGGAGCGAGAIAAAEALMLPTPYIERSVWRLAPFAVPDGVNPRTDRRPPRLA